MKKQLYRYPIYQLCGLILVLLSAGMTGCKKEPQFHKVGDQFQGGTITYILERGDIGFDPKQEHGLIQSDIIGVAAFGCKGTAFQTDSIIGAGHVNSDFLAGACNVPNTAASICYHLELNGYDDWFLPSLDELRTLQIKNSNLPYLSSSSVSENEAMALTFNYTNIWILTLETHLWVQTKINIDKDKEMAIVAFRSY